MHRGVNAGSKSPRDESNAFAALSTIMFDCFATRVIQFTCWIKASAVKAPGHLPAMLQNKLRWVIFSSLHLPRIIFIFWASAFYSIELLLRRTLVLPVYEGGIIFAAASLDWLIIIWRKSIDVAPQFVPHRNVFEQSNTACCSAKP